MSSAHKMNVDRQWKGTRKEWLRERKTGKIMTGHYPGRVKHESTIWCIVAERKHAWLRFDCYL